MSGEWTIEMNSQEIYLNYRWKSGRALRLSSFLSNNKKHEMNLDAIQKCRETKRLTLFCWMAKTFDKITNFLFNSTFHLNAFPCENLLYWANNSAHLHKSNTKVHWMLVQCLCISILWWVRVPHRYLDTPFPQHSYRFIHPKHSASPLRSGTN